MYGAEAWCINASLLLKLESFQSEIGKKILRLPKFSANQVPLLALNWPTMRCHCLSAKLSFLYKIHSSEQSTLSTEVFNSLTFPSIESTLLINQCCLLEQRYSQKFTDEVLTSHEVSKRTNYQSQPFTERSQDPPITIDCCRSCQQYGVAESLIGIQLWITAHLELSLCYQSSSY